MTDRRAAEGSHRASGCRPKTLLETVSVVIGGLNARFNTCSRYTQSSVAHAGVGEGTDAPPAPRASALQKNRATIQLPARKANKNESHPPVMRHTLRAMPSACRQASGRSQIAPA